MSLFTLTNVSSGPASLVACVNRLNGAGGIAPSPISLNLLTSVRSNTIG